MKLLDNGLWAPDFCQDLGLQKWGIDDWQNGLVEGLMKYVVNDVNRRDVCIDLGANVGQTALKFAQYFNHVVAIEADPLTYECLKKNTENTANITCHNFAAFSEKCGISFRRHNDCSGHGSISSSKAREDTEVIKIHARRIDNLYYPGRIDLIKIDIESKESILITSHKDFILKHKPIIMVEMGTSGETALAARETSHNCLKDMGYVLFIRRRRDYIYVQSSELINIMNRLEIKW